MRQAQPKGGAGIRNIKAQNQALGAKLVWKMYQNPSLLWCKIMQRKYLDTMNLERILSIKSISSGSHKWNFMASYRHLITNNLTWKFNNGCRENFWKDSWGGYKPLTEYPELSPYISELSNKYGNEVQNYVKNTNNGLVQCEDFEASEINTRTRNCLREFLKERTICINNQEDIIKCSGAKSREYTTKLGYRIQLKQKERDWPNKLCWGEWILPKFRAFMWSALHERILTSDVLKTIGTEGPN